MAEENQDKPASPEAKPEAPKPARPALRPQALILAGAVVVALGAGSAAGLLLVGPRLAATRAAAPAAGAPEHEADAPEPEAGEAHAREKGKGGHGKEAERAVVFRLDNLIVNPAGSHGSRFLMASVAVELPDAKAEARLRERDFQVRDAVIAVLERQSLETITSPGGRDSVKARLAETLRPMVGRGVPVTVYLPQFVIQ